MRIFSLFTILIAVSLFWGCEDPNTGENAMIGFNPNTILFDITAPNETNTKYLVITNSGEATLKISKMEIVKPIDTELFTIDESVEFPIEVKPNEESQQIPLHYNPVDNSTPTGHLKIWSNDGESESHIVFLKTQAANAIIKVFPESINFGNVAVNKTETIEVTIQNIGTSPLEFSNDEGDIIHLGAGTDPSFSLKNIDRVRTLSPVTYDDEGYEVYDSFTIEVEYTASGATGETGTLVIHNNSINSAPTKILTINANSQGCRLLLQPPNAYIDFGERPYDSENTYTVTLSNAGNGDCSIDSIVMDETISDEEFSMELPDEPVAPFVMAPGERYDFTVYFRPTRDTGAGGASAKISISTDDPYWENGEKDVTLYGTAKQDDSPICVIKNTNGGEPYFEVEPGQRENVECNSGGVCSNVQMVSESFDPNGENITLNWRMVESPASYSNPDWITYPGQDHLGNSNSDNHYVDFYVPYATPPGTRYLVELKVRNDSGLESTCYGEVYGLTGNSLHVELFWDDPSDVDLHVLMPTNQSLRLSDIDPIYPSTDEDLENYRSETNAEYWDSSNDRDCYFGNCTSGGVEWGAPGGNDNPSLDRDDIPGTGPENTNIAQPLEGWYRVAIHYYSDHVDGNVAHVRIYCNGVVAYQNSADLMDTDYWWLVGDIFWKAEGESGLCYIFNDGRIYDQEIGHGQEGYQGNLIEDIEPDEN